MQRSRPITCLLAFALCASSAAPARSAPARAIIEAEDLLDISLEQLEQVIVVARRREELLHDVPLAITAFSARELQRQSIVTPRDLQYQTAGFYVESSNTGSSAAQLNLRGQSASDTLLTTDSSVGVYADGVNIPRVFGLNAQLFDLERVEILKGPQGTLFGRNTTGGAVHLISRRPQLDHVSGFVTGELGDWQRRDLGGAVNVPLVTDHLALRLAARITRSDGWYDSRGDGRPINDDHEQFLRASLTLVPTDAVELTLIGEFHDLDEGGNANIQRHPCPTARDLVCRNATLQGIDLLPLSRAGGAGHHHITTASPNDPDQRAGNAYERQAVTAMLTVETGELTMKSITGYHTFDTRRALDLDAGPTSGHFTLIDSNADFFSQELQLLGGSADTLEWVVGGYFSHEAGDDRSQSFVLRNLTSETTVIDGEVRNGSVAGFAQLNYRLSPGLRLTAGYRYTEEEKELLSRNRRHLDGINGPFVTCLVPDATGLAGCAFAQTDSFDGHSWLLSLDYALRDGLMVYARSARGFKGGGQQIRGLSTSTAAFTPVDPEFARDLEAGLKGDLLGGRLRLAGALYTTDYTDIQRSQIVPVNPANPAAGNTTVIANAAEATINGVELEATFMPVDRLALKSTFNYIDGDYDEWQDLVDDGSGNLAPFDRSATSFQVPDTTWSLSVRWDQPADFGTFGFTLDYYWQDEVVLAPSAELRQAGLIDLATQDSYALLNARVDVNLESSGWALALFARNLTDQAYFTALTDITGSLGTLPGTVGAPRYWGVSVTKRFDRAGSSF